MLIWTDTDRLSFVSVHGIWHLLSSFLEVFCLPSLCLPSSHTVAFPSGTATSGNGDFGDWSAFNQASPCPSASSGELFSSTAQQPAIELFGSPQTASSQPPTASNSTDLFDLMGPPQTAMKPSQSINFCMMTSNAVGISLPMSRSQVCCYLYGLLMTFLS